MERTVAVFRTIRRRVNWDAVGIAVSIAILAAACFALFHLLRDVDFDKIMIAIRAMPFHAIVLAGIMIAASYVCYTFYDLFALRTIGHAHVPYRVAAMAGFLSYTIGHNLGATVLTGGVVRFRIYRAWGLTVIDVAKIAFVTGLTFWLGNAVVLGLGVAYAPDVASTVNLLPLWLNRLLAITVLLAIAFYLLWLIPRPRVLGRDGWKLTLPSAPLTLLQIGIGVADLGLAALAMYVLVSANAPIELTVVLVAFVIATLLGFLSHAPGSLGVFDAAMLVAIPLVDKEALIASLLIFRCLYFVIPFLLAVGIFGVRELARSFRV
jgi:hypothetical protein